MSKYVSLNMALHKKQGTDDTLNGKICVIEYGITQISSNTDDVLADACHVIIVGGWQ